MSHPIEDVEDFQAETQEVDDESCTPDEYIPPTVADHIPALLAGESYEHFSPLPAILQSEPETECVMGIDEAGRGPVLGPMVYSAVFLPTSDEDPLLRDTHGFTDSKALTASVRRTLLRTLCTPATELHARAGHASAVLSARAIAAGMQPGPHGGRGANLNAQAVTATRALVRGVLERGVRVAALYVDALGPPEAHAARLRAAAPEIPCVVVENKADARFAVAGAASVVAKVTRDAALAAMWRARGGEEELVAGNARGEPVMGWGSGYPSDGRCAAWLRREMDPVFGWGNECRFSWGTAKEMLEGKKARVKVDWEEPEDEDGNMTMSRFFVGKGEEAEDELVSWWGRRVGPEVF